MPQLQSNTDPARAIRLRENKRRYRSRQKQYITELEQRLREAREEGIQATKEVQLSAQRVIRENERLKQLLNREGVDDNVIARWIRIEEEPVDEAAVYTTPSRVNSAQMMSSESVCLSLSYLDVFTFTDDYSGGKKPGETADAFAHEGTLLQTYTQKPSTEKAESAHQRPASTSGMPSLELCQASSERACIAQACPPTRSASSAIERVSTIIPPAPCKLNSYLAANPGFDVGQSLVRVEGRDYSDGPDGVECSRAYQMLMQYATTEAKIDTITLALEKGCVSDEGPNGGCKVRKESMWKALDDLQG